MSVQSEIDRIAGAKSDISTAITNKGVTVPSGTKLDGMAALIGSIESGGSGGEINISVSNYTHSVVTLRRLGGYSQTLKQNGGRASFDNLSNGSEIKIESATYSSPMLFFIDNGYIVGDAFPNEEYWTGIMNAAEEFMNTTVMDICSSYGFTNPDTIEIAFDESSGKPAIIIM